MDTKNRSLTNYNIGTDIAKVPPQALDMEEAVLGAIMLEKSTVITVLDILRPEFFYKDAHQKIFSAVVKLSSKGFPVDIFTVSEELKANNELDIIGGQLYLATLTSKVVSAANVEYHARIVAQKYIQRELIRVSMNILNKSYDDTQDVAVLMDESERELFGISERLIKKEVTRIDFVIKEALEEIELASKRPEQLVGVPSSFTELDRMTYGWKRSELIIIAARPSMGKTSFALSMARNMAINHGKKVAIFSCEMSAVQLVNRLMVAESDIKMEKLINGQMNEAEWQQLETMIRHLVQAPIFIDDTPSIKVSELRSKCRRLKSEGKLDVVIIDYLQLMVGSEKDGTREQEVSYVSRTLKSIAKELDVPIIALSQLNRSVEVRSGARKPMLSDLRESGAIEQDADMVLFINRPEKYGIETFEKDGTPTRGMAEIILAKNRNGPVGEIRLRFIEDKAQFAEMVYGEDYMLSDMSEMMPTTLQSKMNDDFADSYGPPPF